MQQALALGLVLTAGLLLSARAAAIMSADGNWGGALGSLFTAPLVVFYLVHTVVYFAVRGLRGRDRIRTYAASRLNWIAAAVALLSVLASAAQRAAAMP